MIPTLGELLEKAFRNPTKTYVLAVRYYDEYRGMSDDGAPPQLPRNVKLAVMEAPQPLAGLIVDGWHATDRAQDSRGYLSFRDEVHRRMWRSVRT